MTQFNFRLKTLLKLNIATRDERRSQLAEAYEAERILKEQIEQIDDEIQELKNRVRSSSEPGEVSVDRLLDTHRYEMVLQAGRQSVEQQTGQLAGEIERRRERLVEADRQVRVFEKLREKQWDAFQQQQNKLEMKQIDEIALRHIEEDGE